MLVIATFHFMRRISGAWLVWTCASSRKEKLDLEDCERNKTRVKITYEVLRLYMYFVGGHKNGLESNSFLSDISLDAHLRALANTANGAEIFTGEAVLIAFDRDISRRDVECYVRLLIVSPSSRVAVIIGILKHLEDKARRARI